MLVIYTYTVIIYIHTYSQQIHVISDPQSLKLAINSADIHLNLRRGYGSKHRTLGGNLEMKAGLEIVIYIYIYIICFFHGS